MSDLPLFAGSHDTLLDEVIPFGKYRNRPLAQLAADKEYCTWLSHQDWVRLRYPQIHTLIINQFGEPDETPAHNALQLRFFDEALRVKISTLALLGVKTGRSEDAYAWLGLMQQVSSPVFEQYGIDVQWTFCPWYVNGGSVRVSFPLTVTVECKPTLGDDYPAVLRKELGRTIRGFDPLRVVVAEEFTAIGGSWLQVQQLFLASHVLLVLLDEVDALPAVELFPEERGLPRIPVYPWETVV